MYIYTIYLVHVYIYHYCKLAGIYNFFTFYLLRISGGFFTPGKKITQPKEPFKCFDCKQTYSTKRNEKRHTNADPESFTFNVNSGAYGWLLFFNHSYQLDNRNLASHFPKAVSNKIKFWIVVLFLSCDCYISLSNRAISWQLLMMGACLKRYTIQ